MDIVDQLRRDAHAPHFTSVGAANLMIYAAAEIEDLREQVKNLPLLLGQVVLAAGGTVRVTAVQLQSVAKLTVTRIDEAETRDAVFTAISE